jgi:hypothetical protein
MSLALLSVGTLLLPLGIARADPVLSVVAMPFAVVGGLGLADDLLFNERITKKLLGLD